jgi:hypothetical protein
VEAPKGTTATSCVPLEDATEAGTLLKRTTLLDAILSKCEPVMVTTVVAGPEVGETELTTGGAPTELKAASRTALVPSGLTTRRLRVPATFAGVVPSRVVGLRKVRSESGIPESETEAPLIKFRPWIVTLVPPSLLPELGETDDT